MEQLQTLDGGEVKKYTMRGKIRVLDPIVRYFLA